MSNEIVIRATGEIVNLDDVDQVIEKLDELRRLSAAVKEGDRLLVGVLNEYAVSSAQPRTVTLPGGGRFVREGGPEKEYDAHAVERDLRAAGMPQEALARIVQRVTTVRVNGAEANKAAKANPVYAEILARHCTTVEKEFRVNRVQVGGVLPPVAK